MLRSHTVLITSKMNQLLVNILTNECQALNEKSCINSMKIIKSKQVTHPLKENNLFCTEI